MGIPLARPSIVQADIDAVVEVLHSSTLSIGPKVVEFEKLMAEVAGTRYAVAVNSGTSGLHLIVKALGIGEGDEVITTPFSFIASSNCILFERATPVFVDIDPETYNIDVNQIEAAITPKTKAILPVHVFGIPANMDEVRRLADKYKLVVIEDSCEAIGAKWNGQPVGSLGDAGVFAFYPNKQITTGEGGVIVTNREDIYELACSMRNQGRGKDLSWLAHDRIGYNYRLDELSAALGVSQANRLPEILQKRQTVADRYHRLLAECSLIKIPRVPAGVLPSWFVYVVELDSSVDRQEIIQYLLSNDIGCRPYFSPLHLQPFYQEQFGYISGNFPVTEDVSRKSLAIPFYTDLNEHDQELVSEVLQKAISHNQSLRH